MASRRPSSFEHPVVLNRAPFEVGDVRIRVTDERPLRLGDGGEKLEQKRQIAAALRTLRDERVAELTHKQKRSRILIADRDTRLVAVGYSVVHRNRQGFVASLRIDGLAFLMDSRANVI